MDKAKKELIDCGSEFWYHGTNEYFSDWEQPPLVSKYKPELSSHEFISLTKDQMLATGAGEVTGGLCRSKLSSSAKVLDLRVKSPDTKTLWQQVLQTDLGRIHSLVQDFDSFLKACSSGEVLRFHTTDKTTLDKFAALQATIQSRTSTIADKANAYLAVQNFTRQWIDIVISPAKKLGYQAVICVEIDRYRQGGPLSCLNLYVFDPAVLLKPEWLLKPDESLMIPHLERIRELGF